ncbi:hypothetical protein C8Q73DRAFT_714723 [Cubamyces lactineus]|nr:hypothetical protein C8Q73DRAFT_714723 [Cubamyces lactineus]
MSSSTAVCSRLTRPDLQASSAETGAAESAATVHLVQWRRWLGRFNAPGLFEIARQYGGHVAIEGISSLFPVARSSKSRDPAMIFGLEGQHGPRFIASYAGSEISGCGHLAHLLARRVRHSNRVSKPIVIPNARRKTSQYDVTTMGFSLEHPQPEMCPPMLKNKQVFRHSPHRRQPRRRRLLRVHRRLELLREHRPGSPRKRAGLLAARIRAPGFPPSGTTGWRASRRRGIHPRRPRRGDRCARGRRRSQRAHSGALLLGPPQRSAHAALPDRRMHGDSRRAVHSPVTPYPSGNFVRTRGIRREPCALVGVQRPARARQGRHADRDPARRRAAPAAARRHEVLVRDAHRHGGIHNTLARASVARQAPAEQ